jgi:hypothetical protein
VIGASASAFVLLGSLLIYSAGLLLLLRNGWRIRAGLIMSVAAFLPVTWQVRFTDSEMPGFALLLLFTLPPAVLIVIAGSCVWIRELWSRHFSRVKS